MNRNTTPPGGGFSRRGFLGLAGFAAAAPVLASCSGGSGGGSGGGGGGGGDTLKFWDMPWGSTEYNVVAKELVEGYEGDGYGASYQLIQWNNFVQTFASAVASNTGPAVSSGGGFQAFDFADQGAIHYADNVISGFESDGTADDFLPGLLEPMKTPEGYAAVPWQLDARVWWARQSLLDEAGTTIPTTWDEYVTACEALKKIGVYGFSSGTGAGAGIGHQGLIAMMINNGGGLFDPDGKLDVTYERNVEAMQFVTELAKAGYIDPGSVSYTSDNVNAQWEARKHGMGINTGGLADNIGDTEGDLVVMSPMTGPNGDKGALIFENNIMMYTNTPSTEASEAFTSWYIKNLHTYWEQPLGTGLPVLQSIVDLPQFQENPNNVKIIEEYVPVQASLAARSKALSVSTARVDSSAPLYQFTQTILTGNADPVAELDKLQGALSGLVE